MVKIDKQPVHLCSFVVHYMKTICFMIIPDKTMYLPFQGTHCRHHMFENLMSILSFNHSLKDVRLPIIDYILFI